MSAEHFQISAETVALLKELLPDATLSGAYAMGMACAVCWSAGIQPPRDLLVRMRNAQSVEEADRVLEAWMLRVIESVQPLARLDYDEGRKPS
jgi:hypothetical protein